MIKNVIAHLSDIIFPRLCFHCDQEIESDCKILCRKCLSTISISGSSELSTCWLFQPSPVLQHLLQQSSMYYYILPSLASLSIQSYLQKVDRLPDLITVDNKSSKEIELAKEVAKQMGVNFKKLHKCREEDGEIALFLINLDYTRQLQITKKIKRLNCRKVVFMDF